MRFGLWLLRLVAASSCAIFAACSGGSTSPAAALTTPPGVSRFQAHFEPNLSAALGLTPRAGAQYGRRRSVRQNWLLPASTDGRIFVSDLYANTVAVFSTKGNHIGSITDGIHGPVGTCVDGKGTLYVANFENNTVSEYLKGATKPTSILSSGIHQPISVGVGSDGTLFVGEFARNLVLEFAVGNKSPTKRITSLTYPEGLAIDAHDNLYIAWNEEDYAGHVDRFALGSTTGKNLGISSGQTGDAKIDRSGNLVLADQVNQMIGVYPAGSTSPSRVIYTIGSDPYKFALNKEETELYVADPDSETVLVFDYKTGAQIGTIYKGLTSALGVSVSPSAPY
jgi:DNA-binding beta-propeller fold protein YncE